MPTHDHRRERGDAARAATLEATHTIVSAEGSTAVTIRRIASAIGYSVPVVYQHFADKTDLLVAVLTAGFEELASEMQAAAARRHGRKAVLAVADAYLAYAHRERHVYELMHGTGGVDIPPASRQSAAAPVIAVTEQVVGSLSSSAELSPAELAERCEIAWAVVHGMATIAGIDEVGARRAARLAHEALEALMDRWEAP